MLHSTAKYSTSYLESPLFHLSWKTTHFCQRNLHFNLGKLVWRDVLRDQSHSVVFQDMFCPKWGHICQTPTPTMHTHTQKWNGCKTYWMWTPERFISRILKIIFRILILELSGPITIVEICKMKLPMFIEPFCTQLIASETGPDTNWMDSDVKN